jgi:hypothetical protein
VHVEEGVLGGLWQRRLTAAALALIAAGSISAEAQELRDRERTLAASRRIAEDLRKARIHYGPFYLLSSIQLSDIGYDQEFFVPTADTTSGFSFGVSAPQRLYITPNKKIYFSIDVTPEYARFERRQGNAKRNQWGLKSRADLQLLLNHLYFDGYVLRNNELRVDTGEIASLLTRRTVEVGAAGELKYSSRTSLTYTALTRSQHFPIDDNKFQPDLPVNLLDRSEHTYRASLVHRTFPRTSVIVAGEYSGYSFAEAVFKNSHRTYGGLGLAYETGRTDVHIEGGYTQLDFIRANQKDFKGGTGSLSIRHRLTDRWRVAGGLSRDNTFSVFADNNYYIANRASISTEAALTQRFSITAAYAVVEDTYDVPTAGAKPDNHVARRRDRISFPSIGWTYSSGHWLTGGFDVGYLTRTSNFPINETEGIRIIIRLSLNL